MMVMAYFLKFVPLSRILKYNLKVSFPLHAYYTISNTSTMLVINANTKLCKHKNSKSCAEIFSWSRHHGISKLQQLETWKEFQTVDSM